MPTFCPADAPPGRAPPRLTRNTVSLLTVSTSIGPLNGMERRGWRLKPSSVSMTSRSWQSDTWTAQSGFGRFTRSQVFWLSSGIVKRSEGNGPSEGTFRLKSAWMPAASADEGGRNATVTSRKTAHGSALPIAHLVRGATSALHCPSPRLYRESVASVCGPGQVAAVRAGSDFRATAVFHKKPPYDWFLIGERSRLRQDDATLTSLPSSPTRTDCSGP